MYSNKCGGAVASWLVQTAKEIVCLGKNQVNYTFEVVFVQSTDKMEENDQLQV